MKRFLFAATAAVASFGALPTAEAGNNYLFERSYYSHAPAKIVEIGPQAHRAPGGPFFTGPRGVAVNSGYRLQRSYMRVGGQIVDQTYEWDTWIQGSGKY
jgi:hypothetical protein